MSAGAISRPRLVLHSHSKPMFSSPALSLALQTSMDGQVEFGEIFESGVVGRLNEDEYESRTASGFMVGDDPSGDDQDIDRPPRKKKNYRHTRRQIQELEAFFKECPHPDEKQRRQLSRRLCLENKQIKFWFQNKRTQMKTQMGRQEISILKHENDKLRVENMSMREAMRKPICFNCGGPVEERNLWIENARLRDEFDRVCALAEKFSGMPVSSLTNTIPSLMPMEPAVRSNGFCNLSNVTATPPLGNGFRCGVSSALPMVPPSRFSTSALPMVPPSRFSTGVEGLERSMYWELALAAMDELVKMAQTDEPLWLPNLEGGRETLNHEEYKQVFPSCIGRKQNGFVTEATRESGMLIINSLALVEILMDANQWVEMFPCMIARSSTTEVISSGVDGTRNGALQIMHAELQVLSPLVPIRDVDFIRFCKQHAEGVWAVVDVSIDINQDTLNTAPFVSYRRLPSGCLVQDMPNGYSKVTWVEHAEYDESSIHQIYRPLISAGMGFGAQRWVGTLQRQCECLATLISTAPNPTDDQTAAMGPSGGWRSILKLAQRMTAKFCAGVCASKEHKWNKICAGNVDQDVRMMSRKSVDDPGEPLGVVLSAATSVWLPVSPQKLFDFLRDEQLRTEWDVLSNGGPMQKMANFDKGQDQGNCVCLLRSTSMNANQSGIMILQETFNDESGSLVVYAPVDMPALDTVMSGGDSACVALLPSGFAILPDGPQSGGPNNNCNEMVFGGGSLLTVGFQILMNSTPTAKLTAESVETVNNLISCTIQKIKGALQHEN